MADNQRPYRPNESYGRPAAPSHAGSDPLAELARLIGQNDPFSDHPRGQQPQRGAQPQRVSAPPQQPHFAQPAQAAPAHYDQQYAAPNGYPQQNGYDAQQYDQQQYDRQQHDRAPPFGMPPGGDVYRTGHEGNGYDDQQHDAQYGQDAYYDNHPREPHPDEEAYDDAPPAKRRFSMMAIAGVVGLAVVGTAGAFGYRAIFGSSSPSQPPVIKAESTPSKLIPQIAADQQKSIQDRVGSGQERLVSREEQPVERAAGNVQPAMGSGVIGGTEPKKIRTIPIRPDDQGSAAEQAPVQQPATQAVKPMQQTAQAAQPRVTNAPIVVVDPETGAPRQSAAPRQQVAAQPQQQTPVAVQHTAPARQQQAAAGGNAPLSLTPEGDAPAAPARNMRTASTSAQQPVQPVRIAPQQAEASASAGGSTYVQVSSQRSEAEAQAAFRGLQGKYPSQLGSRSVVVKSVTLGDKGTYYRALVGPFASGSDAAQLCESLKSAGGQCVIQRN